jgi:hypothetical protein
LGSWALLATNAPQTSTTTKIYLFIIRVFGFVR